MTASPTSSTAPAEAAPAKPVILHLSITPEGGWHSHATALADIMTDQGAEEHLVMRWPGATAPRHAPTIEFRCTWLGRRATGALVTLRQVAATARRHRVSWVHVHGLPSEPVGLGFTLALELVLWGTGAAMAITPHNSFGRRGPIELRWLRRRTLRRFDRVFVFHDDHRSWAGPRSVRAPFVHPGPDQILDSVRGIGRRRAGDRRTGPRIACLPGQIRADKGFHLVPAALAGLDYAIRINGADKGGYAKLRAEAERHGVPLLGRPGFSDEEEFLATIAESDVVILPYARVTQSGVLAYARAAGTPVAGSDVLREAGLTAEAYFDPNDTRSLRAAVDRAVRAHDLRSPAGGTASEPPPTVELYRPSDSLGDLVARLRDGPGVFVVGSPRSGTTVVARWVADQLGTELPPETHYFTLIRQELTRSRSRDHLRGRIEGLPAYAGATGPEIDDVVDTWWSGGRPSSLGDVLSRLGQPWVEKTPGHLRRWPQLLRFDQRAQILVVTRAAPATLVSQSEVGWLADRSPQQLLARLLADRIHGRLLSLVAPERVHRLRYEHFVSMVEVLPDTPGAALGHESWKTLSAQRALVTDRNDAARARRPEVWQLGTSPLRRAAALPGALARVVVDLGRSTAALRWSSR